MFKFFQKNSTNNPFGGGEGYGNGIAWNGYLWVAVGTGLDSSGNSVCIALLVVHFPCPAPVFEAQCRLRVCGNERFWL